jgi:Txe/YoeB family toxin of Txe-Axe toxin-antitoxin module
MSHINPVNPNFKSQKASDKVLSKVEKLANKVSSLAKEINKQWDALDPYALAEKIVTLQETIEGTSFPGIEKMRQLADNFHFQFVFPVVRDFRSFAKSIKKVANEILKTNSLAPFYQLSPTQQKEILRGIS